MGLREHGARINHADLQVLGIRNSAGYRMTSSWVVRPNPYLRCEYKALEGSLRADDLQDHGEPILAL